MTYGALKRHLDVDDDYVDDQKAELIDARQLAVDEQGKVLVWTGRATATPEPASAPLHPVEQPTRQDDQGTQAPRPPVDLSLPAAPASGAVSRFSLTPGRLWGTDTPSAARASGMHASAQACHPRWHRPAVCIAVLQGASIRCPHCQHENREDARFCAACGGALASRWPSRGRGSFGHDG